MTKYICEYENEKYKVGCTGGTILIIERSTGKEIDKIKLPYISMGVFVPFHNIFIAKSTAGTLLKYDIETKETIKKRISNLTQDGGMGVCPWDGHLYNIEMTVHGFQIVIYDVNNMDIIATVPIKGDIVDVADLEFGLELPVWYVSLSYFYKGRVKNAIAKMEKYNCVGYKEIDFELFNHAIGYKCLERTGFTEDALGIAKMFSDKCQTPISFAELYIKTQ